MQRAVIVLLLVILSVDVSAETVLKGIGVHSVVRGSGDVLVNGGAAVTLSGESTGDSGFLGAITSLDATPFRGKEVRLAGALGVISGNGNAALWVRADGPKGQLAFGGSGREPVRAGEGLREREIWLYIPSNATNLKFGVTLNSEGRLDVERLTLSVAPSTSAGLSACDMVVHVLPIIRANALNAGNVDWSAEERRLLTTELKYLPAMEAYGRIRVALDALADHHSFLEAPRRASRTRNTAVASQPIETRALSNIGYVLVPGLRGTEAGASSMFSTQLCEQIANLAPTATRGWIIDLRQNTGGNMWPMLSGLHAFLGDAEIGALRSREGRSTRWRIPLSNTCGVDLSGHRVAVLVGPKTASSGEAVAIAFSGRPETRFFGQPTAGLATSNHLYALPDGGALLLTTALMVDRHGKAYPQGIAPETIVSNDQEVTVAAADWLHSMP